MNFITKFLKKMSNENTNEELEITKLINEDIFNEGTTVKTTNDDTIIEPTPTITPEEAAAEEAKIKKNMDNFVDNEFKRGPAQ